MTDALYHDLLRSFVKLLELRNPFNIDHCQLVAQYCDRLAEQVGLAPDNRQRLLRAAEIHTLGVLLQMEEKQPDRILPISGLGTHSGREVSIHQREEQIFRHILSQFPAFHGCLEILLQRHEWYDGSGSISGLSGQQICPEARLMAVVDAYVDLVTPKAHRPPESHPVALERLQEMSGLQFDPFYVEALERCLEMQDEGVTAQRLGKFQAAHCRHYLGLGHFYTQIHESEWALRSYLAAERMAARTGEAGLELGAISGQFMVFCDRGQLERAREILQQVRSRGRSARDKLGYQLLWGLLEWLEENPLGKEILQEVIRKHSEHNNLPGQAAALAFQSCMTLFQQGDQDPEHLAYLKSFLELLGNHDVFDVVERYRPYTIPVLLNAVVQGIRSQLARNLLTRMGEPCHGPLHERLKGIHPSQWTRVLMSDPVLSEAEAGHTPVPEQWDLYIETLGPFQVMGGSQRAGVEAWQSLKNIKVFLRLASHSGRTLNSELLAEELWPESGLKKGRDSLRNSLAQIRRTLRNLMADESLEVVSRSRKSNLVGLELRCRFDYEDFEALFARSQAAYQEGSGRALALAQEALALYRADFLEGFDEDWVVAARSRLAAQRYHAMTVVARSHLQQGNYQEVERWARDLIGLDDLREEAHDLLLEALVGQGRSVEAVAHYERTEELFEQEIGVFPERLRESLARLKLLI
jgi:two-component SAPR family response regulator